MSIQEIPAAPSSGTDKIPKKAKVATKYLDNVTIGALALFVSFFGLSLTFPFLQSQRDKLGCDSLCYGGMQAVRSGLSLFGNVLVGRMSDRYGRMIALYVGIFASLFSFLVNFYGTSITAMWISIIPMSLLNQNFSVMKACFADLSNENGYSESERASAMGKLGMVVGISFMIGPVAAATFCRSYTDAVLAAILLTVISAFIFSQLTIPQSVHETEIPTKIPQPSAQRLRSNIFQTIQQKIVDIFFIPSMKIPGAQLLLVMRCFMALAYHIFMIVWTVSLKDRFDFGPKDHAYFMGWIGLCYSISQGILTKVFIQLCGSHSSRLLQGCVLALGIGRVMVMNTVSLTMVYAITAVVIIALGVVNTLMSSVCASIAGKEEVGGLYGVMEAVESLAGMVGPGLGGLLQRWHPQLPIVSVVTIYAFVFLMIFLFYERYITSFIAQKGVDAESVTGVAPTQTTTTPTAVEETDISKASTKKTQ